MTAAYALTDYLPRMETPRVRELPERSYALDEEFEANSKELRVLTKRVIEGMNRLVSRVDRDAAAGALPDLDQIIDQITASELDWAERFLPLMGMLMGHAFQCRRLQRDFARLKKQRELAKAAKSAGLLQADVELMAKGLEAMRDARIHLALIWSRFVESRDGQGPTLSSSEEVAKFFKSISSD